MTVEGFADKVKGTAKEAAGKITDDPKLETEGKLDKAEGAVKDAVEDVKTGVEAAGEKIKDAL